MSYRTSRCRSCGAEIIWAITEKRKRQALNAKPDPAGNVAAHRDHTGTWLARSLKKDEKAFGWERVFMPHAATCTPPPPPPKPRLVPPLHQPAIAVRQRPVRPVPNTASLPPNVIPISAARRRLSPRHIPGRNR